MRSVSLVNRLELEFPGTLLQNGLCFGDVDNDQMNELVACNTNGDMIIYKGKNIKPWRKCTGLGFVTVVVVDCIMGYETNNIFVLNASGLCFTFDFSISEQRSQEDKGSKPQSLEKTKKNSHSHLASNIVMPKFKQHISPNCKTAIAFDMDGDGRKELIVGYTDRTVRILKWHEDEKSNEPGSSKKLTYKLVKQPSKDEDKKLQGPIKQSSKDSAKDLNINSTESDGIENVYDEQDPFSELEEGKFVVVKKIGLLAQIGSLAVCSSGEGNHHLLASQPGGGYIVLDSYYSDEVKDSPWKSNFAEASRALDSYPVCYLSSGTRSRPLVGNTEIIGSVNRQGRLSGLLGFCTLDGVFGVMDFFSKSRVFHQRTVEHKWFTMDKLDITMDGNDEILFCAWDGMTYVLNRHQDILSYNFGENVCAFKAGMYSLQAKSSVPCLCYATFANRIMLYYDIKVDSMEGKSLYNAILERLQSDDKYSALLESLKDDSGIIDRNKLRSALRL